MQRGGTRRAARQRRLREPGLRLGNRIYLHHWLDDLPVGRRVLQRPGAAEGSYLVDLANHIHNKGGIRQTFATVAGTACTLSFSNTQNSYTHFAFIDGASVTAVPEPGNWALMVGRLLAMASAVRRRHS